MNKKIFGHIDTSFIDFQGKYSIVLYFSGCQLRCPYCFNQEVVFGRPNYSLEDVQSRYRYLLDTMPNMGVVLTGGEPTINEYFEFVLNYFKHTPKSLHTNGLVLVEKARKNIESVVIGLKGPLDLPRAITAKEYKKKFREACMFYKNVPYREIRGVEIPEYEKFYKDVLKNITGYKINYVEDARYESQV